MDTRQDWTKLLKKAHAGDAEAQYNAAMEYYTGLTVNKVVIVAQNEAKAYQWIKAAAEQGHNLGRLALAAYLSQGKYCTRDLERAISIYKQLIGEGESMAAHDLGIVYRDMKQFKRAFKLYQLALTMSGEKESLEVALCYYHGIGTTKDIKKAREILLLMSDGTITASGYDENEANYLLGLMYLNGEGVKCSLAKAREYLLKANADLDHRSATQLLNIIGQK